MKRMQAWKLLMGIFATFWVIFAIILIFSGIPFYVVSIALTTVAMLSLLVIALAWAYQNNF
ncbi:MAG: hypothetical protein ACJ795_11415 [Ktedonobacteraceae bacterium]